VEVITNTAIHVNKKQLEAENIQKVIAVQNILTGKKLEVRIRLLIRFSSSGSLRMLVQNLIDPQRRFVREGELGEVVKDNKAVTRYCVLFNDLMVKCKLPKGSTVKKKSSTKNQDSMKFEFLAKIPLAGGSLVNTGDEGDIKHSFQVCLSFLDMRPPFLLLFPPIFIPSWSPSQTSYGSAVRQRQTRNRGWRALTNVSKR